VAKLISVKELAKTIATNSRKPHKSFWRDISRTAGALKAAPIEPEEKNCLWSIQAFADATVFYLDAYRLMARGKFYDGWSTLEHAELGLARLVENLFIEELAPFVQSRAELVALWQSLFPYRHFVSPGMLWLTLKSNASSRSTRASGQPRSARLPCDVSTWRMS
jgi:hypothetical protein